MGIFPKYVENSRLMVYIYIHQIGCKAILRRYISVLFGVENMLKKIDFRRRKRV
jgi:hypothetical protein